MIRETLCTRWQEKPKNPTGIEENHFAENDPGMKMRNQEVANLEESNGMCETVNKAQHIKQRSNSQYKREWQFFALFCRHRWSKPWEDTVSLGITSLLLGIRFKIIIPLWKDNVKEKTCMPLHFLD